MVPITLDERVQKADLIFEGKVISATSYWDDTHSHIFTANVVSIYKIFKGTTSATEVEIITRGGTVGDKMETVSNTLELTVGQVGLFTSVANTFKLATSSGRARFKAYAGAQGFIKYDARGKASDVFNSYNSVDSVVYPEIEKRTRTKRRMIKKADFKTN